METLQQQVQQHLQNTGISLSELARRSGISHQAIGKIRALLGEYKNSTADALRIAIKPKTLDATVEQLAVRCIDSDLTHVRDDALECGKQRRIAALEAEVSAWRGKADKTGLRVSELNMLVQRRDAELSDEKRNFAALEQVHEQREQHLKSCENALIEAHVRDTDLECAKYRRVMRLEQQLNDANTAYLSSKSQHERDLQRLNDAQDKLEYMKKWLAGEDGRKLQDYQAQIGKAEAMILGLNESNECLQRQLDQSQAVYSKLYNQLGATRTKYETQLEAANQKEAQLQEQLTEVYAEKTRQEAQIMRLRMYVWILIAALALVVVSGLVVWGGV